MNNWILFFIGLAVSFTFLGGMIIHTVVSQRISEDEILEEDDSTDKTS